ncbi:hypothetical protein DU002_11210 [Corallincola holothuriorum]|uniref:Lipoprotein n=1 Tax=Corallincola holothuriorum TaxID=2282215 RepID=A0A368NHY2_9GAMM|nr:hypothetical protein [Corallincola holothuriorum]RCU49483.1 hypothetical protein DU002_11210 [Corallincola holothuriorum]
MGHKPLSHHSYDLLLIGLVVGLLLLLSGCDQHQDAELAFHPSVDLEFPEPQYYGAMFLASAVHRCASDKQVTPQACVENDVVDIAVLDDSRIAQFSLLQHIDPGKIRACDADDQAVFPHHSEYPETSVFWVCFDMQAPYEGQRLLLHLQPTDHPPSYRLVGIVRF